MVTAEKQSKRQGEHPQAISKKQAVSSSFIILKTSNFGGTLKQLEAATQERPTCEALPGEAAPSWHWAACADSEPCFPLEIGSPSVRQDGHHVPCFPADTSQVSSHVAPHRGLGS